MSKPVLLLTGLWHTIALRQAPKPHLLTSTLPEKRAKLDNLLHRFGKNQVTGRLELGEDSTLIEAPQ